MRKYRRKSNWNWEEKLEPTLKLLNQDETKAMKDIWALTDKEKVEVLDWIHYVVTCRRNTYLWDLVVSYLGEDYEVKVLNIYYWLKSVVTLKNREAC